MKRLNTCFLLFFIVYVSFPLTTLHAQSSLLQSGPMVGYSEMKEVLLWVQTRKPARVKFIYWEREKPDRRYSTAEMMTTADNAGVAKLIADSLEPGLHYTYALYINGKEVKCPYPLEFQSQRLWQWREDPPAFSVALGSCTYINEPDYDRPGTPYGGDYAIFTSIHARHPDMMLWLGDNVYLREVDWYTRTGVLHRYTHGRSLPELQPLLGSTHNYAIWDDHDFGPNDSDRGFREKEKTLEAFKLFWGNPTYGTDSFDGITTKFEWGDAEFFLLDNRYHRSPNRRTTGERQLLGDEQMQWLIDGLASSNATFKIVAIGGQVLNPVARFENYSIFPEERQKLLDLIAKEKIPGVIFVTGDRHHTELTKMPREGTYPLYDLTVSPLTSTAAKNADEPNTLRVPDTYVSERNFATLEFSGPRAARVITIRVFGTGGNELWKREITAEELK
jgi:alkaline phosphatase D